MLSVVAVAPVQVAAQSIDDLGNTLDGGSPGKKTAPDNPPVKKTPPVKKAAPARTPRSAPTLKPGEEPGARPVSPGRSPVRPAGGISVSGIHYASLNEYMYGVWRWRNKQGQLMHLSFFRNRTFLAFNTVTQVRVYGRFWSVANRQLYVSITRVCRFRNCRPPPRQVRRAFPTYPVSTNVVRNGNERWTRIRRY